MLPKDFKLKAKNEFKENKQSIKQLLGCKMLLESSIRTQHKTAAISCKLKIEILEEEDMETYVAMCVYVPVHIEFF